ncbi:MAG: hypothetical protein U0L25_01670 [Ligilactobacillus ruminis]|nr:hypothetical protein [Ligilactobacillus ruminis]
MRNTPHVASHFGKKVVMRNNYFNVAILGTTKKVKPVPMVNIDYDWQDIIR